MAQEVIAHEIGHALGLNDMGQDLDPSGRRDNVGIMCQGTDPFFVHGSDGPTKDEWDSLPDCYYK